MAINKTQVKVLQTLVLAASIVSYVSSLFLPVFGADFGDVLGYQFLIFLFLVLLIGLSGTNWFPLGYGTVEFVDRLAMVSLPLLIFLINIIYLSNVILIFCNLRKIPRRALFLARVTFILGLSLFSLMLTLFYPPELQWVSGFYLWLFSLFLLWVFMEIINKYNTNEIR